MSDVTRILGRIESGDPSAARQLMPLVYEELRKLAAARLANERPDHTLQATALVHEAYLRLVGPDQGWESRGHFFAAAANSMRQILVDWALAKGAAKRRRGVRHVEVDSLAAAGAGDPDVILDLDEALTQLADEGAIANDDVPRAAELLQRHVPGPGDTDLRGFEWHYFQKRIHVPHLVEIELGGWTDDVKLSPDGAWLAATAPGGVVLAYAGRLRGRRRFRSARLLCRG